MATNPQAQGTTPAVSLATLRQAVAELEQAHPEYGQRPFRAATIVALRNIEPTPAGWLVESERDPDTYYLVSQDGMGVRCCCVDYRNRGGLLCKHILAVNLLARCKATLVDNMTPFPLERYSDADRFELTPKGEAYLAAQEPGPVA